MRLVEVQYTVLPERACGQLDDRLPRARVARVREALCNGAGLSWRRLLLTFLIGLSRPMLGVHWPSDVIGGWSFGALWVLLICAMSG